MSSRVLRRSRRTPWCGSIARIAAVLAFASGVIASSALLATTARAQVPAPPGGGSSSLRAEAVAIMNLTYKEFTWLKHNDPVPPFDWSSDGCSWTPPAWANLMNPACQLHDFGYRNFGKGLKLDRNEKTRAWIDHRFLVEMDRICQDRYHAWYRRANWLACRGEAWTMYGAVRNANNWSSPKHQRGPTPSPTPGPSPTQPRPPTHPTPSPSPGPAPTPPTPSSRPAPAPLKRSDDAYPCGARVHVRWDSALDQQCPLTGALREPGGYWVPAYAKATAEGRAAVTPIGWLHSTSGQYFRCQARFARDYVHPRTGWRNDWWAYAKTDDGHWWWVPEVYFHGGSNDQPDAGLVTC
jgi:Prokaryotic phospholipase A2